MGDLIFIDCQNSIPEHYERTYKMCWGCCVGIWFAMFQERNNKDWIALWVTLWDLLVQFKVSYVKALLIRYMMYLEADGFKRGLVITKRPMT